MPGRADQGADEIDDAEQRAAGAALPEHTGVEPAAAEAAGKRKRAEQLATAGTEPTPTERWRHVLADGLTGAPPLKNIPPPLLSPRPFTSLCLQF